MRHYWSERLEHALRSSREARSAELRQLHLELAEHYKALSAFCSKPVVRNSGNIWKQN